MLKCLNFKFWQSLLCKRKCGRGDTEGEREQKKEKNIVRRQDSEQEGERN